MEVEAQVVVQLMARGAARVGDQEFIGVRDHLTFGLDLPHTQDEAGLKLGVPRGEGLLDDEILEPDADLSDGRC